MYSCTAFTQLHRICGPLAPLNELELRPRGDLGDLGELCVGFLWMAAVTSPIDMSPREGEPFGDLGSSRGGEVAPTDSLRGGDEDAREVGELERLLVVLSALIGEGI